MATGKECCYTVKLSEIKANMSRISRQLEKTEYFGTKYQYYNGYSRKMHKAYMAWKARNHQIDEELRQLRVFISAPI